MLISKDLDYMLSQVYSPIKCYKAPYSAFMVKEIKKSHPKVALKLEVALIEGGFLSFLQANHNFQTCFARSYLMLLRDLSLL